VRSKFKGAGSVSDAVWPTSQSIVRISKTPRGEG
jgi:hypothetical protein